MTEKVSANIPGETIFNDDKPELVDHVHAENDPVPPKSIKRLPTLAHKVNHSLLDNPNRVLSPISKTDRSPNGYSHQPDTVSIHSNRSSNSNKHSDSWVKLRNFLSELMSYMISFLVAMAYMVAGGYLFVSLEFENEKNACQELARNYREKYNSSVEKALSLSLAGHSETEMEKYFAELMKEWADEVYKLSFDPSTDCDTLGTEGNLANWNTLNAMFLTLTIMTTIGYGHISPSTMWGQIVCIIYTVIGIPLMVIFLAKIGDLMATVFRYTYLNVCCCKCFIKHYKEKEVEEEHRPPSMGAADPEQAHFQNTPPERESGPIIIEDEELEEIDYSDMEINVPISVSLLILAAYNLMGAALFTIWEEWTIVQGTYFSFISLTTVGFGDFYPTVDTGMGRPDALDELLVGMLYTLFGLALLSMCLQLIQDEFVAKIVWLSEKMGCRKKEDLEEEIVDDEEQVENFPPPITARPETTHTNQAFNQTEC